MRCALFLLFPLLRAVKDGDLCIGADGQGGWTLGRGVVSGRLVGLALFVWLKYRYSVETHSFEIIAKYDKSGNESKSCFLMI